MNDDQVGVTGYDAGYISQPDGTVFMDEVPQQPVNPSQTKKPTYADILGRRLDNPLSKYSSYTYQLSLYMITPDAYDVFVKNGRRSIEIVNQPGADCSGGAFLIAQSGGINNKTTYRAPGFEFDFFLDNLVMEAAISPDATSSPTTGYKMSFTVQEQYGFSFITNLKRAKDELDFYSKTPNNRELRNADRQFFVMGIKFLGYDQKGEVINAKNVDETFERYYDIYFGKIDFKIDGRTVTYNIEATPVPTFVAMGQRKGVIDKGAHQLQGATVEQLVNELCNKLNQDQLTDVESKKKEFANTYSVRFIGEAEKIAKSSVVTSADLNKINWPNAVAEKKSDVNLSLAVSTQPNNNQRIFAFNRDTPIIQAVQQIINQSEYLINGLKVVYSSEPASEPVPVDSKQKAKWFNISPVVSNFKFDRRIRDFACDITYEIRTYETPVVLSSAADNVTDYYGPFKRYEYWLTGKNSEIIRYEQTMNNAYFVVAIDPSTGSLLSDKGTGGGANIPANSSKRTPVPRLGALDTGREAQNNYVTSLVDPGAYASATIQILGDPDLLSNEMPTGNPDIELEEQPFYGPDGYSIDPKRGQIFIEIDFKEAVDYDNNLGYMRVNDKILFWEYPLAIRKLTTGIIYKVSTIRSTFRGGKFTQDLSLLLATFGNDQGVPIDGETQRSEDEQVENVQQRGTGPVGLTADKEVGSTSGGDPCGPVAAPQDTAQLRDANGVSDDDGVIRATLASNFTRPGEGI